MTHAELESLHQSLVELSRSEKLIAIEWLARSLQEASQRDVDIPLASQVEVGVSDVVRTHSSPIEQLRALGELRKKVAGRPLQSTNPGWSNRDHDRVLYGDKP